VSAPPLALHGAAVAYEGRTALAGVDLAVEAGEVVAVLGANGSGKSTMVRAALGLVPLSAGRAELFGQPVGRFSGWSRVGYVPQRVVEPGAVPATVREVVSSGRLPLMRRWRPASAADRAAVDGALTAVGLADRARDSLATLSGGQQQRVLIARALVCAPELLVLDEPTSGVDLPSQQALADTLGELAGGGLTVVLVAHELGPMHPLITRAVILSGGRVRFDGPAPALDQVHAHDPSHAHPHHDAPLRGLL
jgi:zinc transport system ATP-binding protein